MVRARAAIGLGVLVVLAVFMLGTERQWSAQVGGETYDCGPSISASWLVPGTTDPGPDPALTTEQRRVATACDAVIDRSHVVVLGAMGAGGLLALAGWSAVSVRREPGDRLALGA